MSISKINILRAFKDNSDPAFIRGLFPEDIIPNKEKGVALYDEGKSFAHDEKTPQGTRPADKGEVIWKMLNAALNGNGAAYAYIGAIILHDRSREKHARESYAVKWFQMATRLNDPRGQYHYGRMLFEGIGIAKDEELGASYLEAAHKLRDPHAGHYLQHSAKADGILKERRSSYRTPKNLTQD